MRPVLGFDSMESLAKHLGLSAPTTLKRMASLRRRGIPVTVDALQSVKRGRPTKNAALDVPWDEDEEAKWLIARGGASLSEIADVYGVTPQYVLELEKTAIRRLTQTIERHRLPYLHEFARAA